jgi:ferrous iron transport protein A
MSHNDEKREHKHERKHEHGHGRKHKHGHDHILTLANAGPGTTCRILKVGGEGELRRRLLDMGLTPNTQVLVRKVAPMGDPIELYLRSYELTIRKDDAKKILVEEVSQ